MFNHTEWQRERRREDPQREWESSRRYCRRHKNDPEWQIRRKATPRRHYDLHKEDCLANTRLWHQRLNAAIEHYGKTCWCCGESTYEFLCIDHINGGGNQQRKELGGSRNFFSWLKKKGYPEGFRTGMEVFADDVAMRWRLHLKDIFEHMPAHSLQTSQLKKYKADRLAEKDKPAVATVNRELQVLRRAFKLAADHEPPKVARAKVRLRHGGQRADELLHTGTTRHGSVRINTSKSGEPREVPLTPHLLALVKPLLVGKNQDELLFAQDIRYAWRRIRKAAGCPKAIFHDFRRTAARNKRAAGVDATVIMDLQGWKSIAMFKRYGIVSHQDKLAALRKAEQAEQESRKRAKEVAQLRERERVLQ